MEGGNPDCSESNTSLLDGGLRNNGFSLYQNRNDGLISYQNRNDGLIPQLFTSVPALNEAASYLAETTSYLSRCFIDYSVDPSYSLVYEQEMTTFPSERTREYLDSATQSSSGSYSMHSESCNPEAASPVSDEITRSSPGDMLQNNGVLVAANPSCQNGISLFQGLIDWAQRTVRGSADDVGWIQHASASGRWE